MLIFAATFFKKRKFFYFVSFERNLLKKEKKLAAATYIQPKVAVQRYGVSRATLSTWARTKKVRSIKTGDGPTSGHRYHEQDLRTFLGVEDETPVEEVARIIVIYARVSSSKQKDAGDLQRQVDMLKEKRPEHHKVITDVASGLNFKRKGLTTLLDLVESNRVQKVVVSYKDRLARFGVELIERSFVQHGTTLDVVSREQDRDDAAHQELAEDLLAVCNFFVAKHNGRRTAAFRRDRQQRQTPSADSSGSSSEDDQDQAPRPKRGRPRASA